MDECNLCGDSEMDLERCAGCGMDFCPECIMDLERCAGCGRDFCPECIEWYSEPHDVDCGDWFCDDCGNA